MSHTNACPIYEGEECNCYVEPEPTQWELYSTDLDGNSLAWCDNANTSWSEWRPLLWILARYRVDKLYAISTRTSPLMKKILTNS